MSSSQQDAQEFLRFLLDKLHTEINRRPNVRKTGKEPEQKYARFRSASRNLKNASLKPFLPNLTSMFLHFLTTNRIAEEAAVMWKKHLERDDSIIVGEKKNQPHCFIGDILTG